jgi:hypothetical protein
VIYQERFPVDQKLPWMAVAVRHEVEDLDAVMDMDAETDLDGETPETSEMHPFRDERKVQDGRDEKALRPGSEGHHLLDGINLEHHRH